ncbi:DegT/DnrJ/EryC1/StrS family aminotransferase [bacterium]|nr:DegT/DnrJ/EryC1/StrS family aminotransferase [bacterium]
MQTIPYLDLKAQYRSIRTDVLAELEAVCESAQFAQGPPTRVFEQEWAAYCGVAHCVTVNSGTSALHLALRCLNVGPGDEVITVSMTFIATAWAIAYVGAKPVFVDIDPQRRTLDPAHLEATITPRTKAIIAVHLYGMPADMAPIMEIAERRGIAVVEDAAQAHGARYQSRRVGQFGALACFSFYPGKNLGAYGEGGALVTNREEYAARARALRDHAQRQRYHHDETGYNYRMDSFQAAVLSVKLKHLDDWSARRNRHAEHYASLLPTAGITPPAVFEGTDCVWHCYAIETEQRDLVRERLQSAGIATAIHYPVPVHLQKPYAALGYAAGALPATEQLSARCLSLPMFPELRPEDVETVVRALGTCVT